MSAPTAERLRVLAAELRAWADECDDLAATFTVAEDQAIRVRPVQQPRPGDDWPGRSSG